MPHNAIQAAPVSPGLYSIVGHAGDMLIGYAGRRPGSNLHSQSVCGGPSSSLSLAVNIAIRRSASASTQLRACVLRNG